ncbi:hypothetical protein ADIS_1228 [Lunatimonas lonarensis]|uniref:DinB-like domain-containing protein n=2 Tax=Lunatimonas lonarensis TaxID=1232681 RepID=R7ZW41_9BACT|nr:hypothetical protein ADIS_1228 [Lunatimonas lonarensis]
MTCSRDFILFSGMALLSVSLMAFASPQAVMDMVQVDLSNTDAFSSIRGVYGGVGLTIFITLVYLARKNPIQGLGFLVMLWGFYALSRVLTILIEGELGPFGSQWLFIETILFATALGLLTAHKVVAKTEALTYDSQSKTDWISKMEALVEEQLQTSTEVFQNLPEEILLYSQSGEWSVAGCLEHLNTYAAHYLPRIQGRLAPEPESQWNAPVRKSWLASYFIRMMEPSENGKKYKAVKKHQPQRHREDPYQSVATFIDSLETVQQILYVATNTNLNKGRVATSISPLVGLTPGEAIEFLLVHNQRHIAQAKAQLAMFPNR